VRKGKTILDEEEGIEDFRLAIADCCKVEDSNSILMKDIHLNLQSPI
jgi:hypothetical protein